MRRALVVAVLLAALVAIAVSPRPVSAGKPCAVPKSWGSLKAATFVTYGAVSGEHLVFEAEDGTIRIVNAECGDPAKATTITRTP